MSKTQKSCWVSLLARSCHGELMSWKRRRGCPGYIVFLLRKLKSVTEQYHVTAYNRLFHSHMNRLGVLRVILWGHTLMQGQAKAAEKCCPRKTSSGYLGLCHCKPFFWRLLYYLLLLQ